ncbi:50S ribosomal protein L3 N(5)-glutamine methyltransferase [Limnohabitans sp.]|uniref:50S ribosomal protein L3 N(5)-glutamine methyltransferase n=1 Tax=Limnohabitans sp. TaxID=1907725 RepID=UPI00286F2AB9|nr:50S ribosomal protein L3 N(5)-glutamine methyltransferase [Limnohabitans sp.]
MNLSDLVQQSAEQLTQAQVAFGHGTTNAADEAAWLVLWKLGLPLDTDVSDEAHNLELPAAQVASVQAFIEHRLASRKPAAYLTQEAWLQGVSFYIDERAIVPRSLIAEVLAEGSIDPWLDPNTTRVLDLCTGNGSLGILAALAFPDITVQGLDLSKDALAVAHINIERHGLDGRMTLAESDGLAKADGVFDLILCNPPYVNSQSMSELPAEFKAEPALALAGGDDGMDFIRQMLRNAPAHMSENAVLVLEIGHERDYFETAFPHLDVVWLSTSAGDDQVLLLTRQAIVEGANTQ